MSWEELSEGVKLAKLIADRGLASRRQAEIMIMEGRVTVNDEPARVADRVDPKKDQVRIDGRGLPREPEKVYLLMYKPKGYITSRNDPEERRNVYDLLGDLKTRVEPIGRLDFETEGVLLFTNDGDLAHKLTHPSREVPKRYMVKVYREPSPAKLKAIEEGRVQLDDGKVKPAKVRVAEKTDNGNAWVEITVTEGRNSIIRRMFQQLHHPVAKLRRESFATISLRGMERGGVRALTPQEVRRLQDIADGKKAQNAGRVRRKKGFARPKPRKHPVLGKKQQARRRKSGKKTP